VNTGPVRPRPASRGATRPAKALPGELALRDGTPALIWPLLPTDARMLREGFRQLSPESRRRRFLSPLDDLDEAMIARLVGAVDGVHHIALVLVVLPPGGPDQPVGIARLVQDPSDPATGDIGVTVLDPWQGQGVGTALVRALMRRRPRDLRQLRTVVDADNHASLALLAGAGHLSSGPARMGVVDVTVALPAAPAA
jgi:RimJ/RimL family protein N-acetyltransferase